MSHSNENTPQVATYGPEALEQARQIARAFLQEDILDPRVERDGMSEAAERAQSLQDAGQYDDYNGVDYSAR